MARESASAARPWCTWDIQLLGCGVEWGGGLFRFEIVALVTRREGDLGWKEGGRRVFEMGGFGLKRGQKEGGEKMVSIEEKEKRRGRERGREIEMVGNERKRGEIRYCVYLIFDWSGIGLGGRI